jgi:hypothetical protein
VKSREERASWPVRRYALGEEPGGVDPDVAALTVSQRIALVERLTRNAWAMKGEPVDGARLRRDVVRTERGGR